jgi:hypothetical protein
MSDKNLEQWTNVKFCVKIGKSTKDALALLTLSDCKYAMKKTNVFVWHMQFKEEEDVQDDPRCGQSKT